MPEVIDLISSSPPGSPPKPTKQDHPIKKGSADWDFHLLTDEAGEAGSLDFSVGQLSKKRKLSPVTKASSPVEIVSVSKEALIELLSEDDDDLGLPIHAKGNLKYTSVSLRGAKHDVDPIEFSSSAPQRGRKSWRTTDVVHDLSSDDLPDNIFDIPISSSAPVADDVTQPAFMGQAVHQLATSDKRSSGFMSKPKRTTAELLAALATGNSFSQAASKDRMGKVADIIMEDIIGSSPPKSARKKSEKSSKPTETEKEVKAAKIAAARATKDAEKEAEKERKRAEKERRALEKQKAVEIAEVNRSKTNKKNSTPEMLLDMSSFLEGTSVGDQVEAFMKELDIETTFFDGGVTLGSDGLPEEPPGNIIKWRRRITACYNERIEIWEPSPRPRVEEEKHILVYLKAVEFAAIAAGATSPNHRATAPATEAAMKSNFDKHVAFLRSRHASCTVIYLIEGLANWLKRNENAKNRAYTAAVRSTALGVDDQPRELPPSSAQPPKGRKRKKPAAPSTDLSYITGAMADALQLHLQLAHQPLLIHHTTSVHTTAAQISTFTQHLSTRPYRLATLSHNLKSASFCMDSGQVRTGENTEETYVKMLQEIQRVTPSMAYGIRNAGYESVRELVEGFRKEGREMLQDVKKSANKDGAWSDRRLGPQVSKRLHKVFIGRDPTSMDGIS